MSRSQVGPSRIIVLLSSAGKAAGHISLLRDGSFLLPRALDRAGQTAGRGLIPSHYVDMAARVEGILEGVQSRGRRVVQFNVSLLMREPIGSRRQYQVDEQFSPIEGEDLSVALQGPVSLLRTDRGILAIAEFRSLADGDCARCLVPASYPMTLQIEEEFLPRLDPLTGGPLPEPTDLDAFMIDAHNILDLTEVARQSWLVVLPMQVLCREDCAGLCPECGADHNAGNCACEKGPIDIRWAALVPLRVIDSDHVKEN